MNADRGNLPPDNLGELAWLLFHPRRCTLSVVILSSDFHVLIILKTSK
jgi:hypothetical protein